MPRDRRQSSQEHYNIYLYLPKGLTSRDGAPYIRAALRVQNHATPFIDYLRNVNTPTPFFLLGKEHQPPGGIVRPSRYPHGEKSLIPKKEGEQAELTEERTVLDGFAEEDHPTWKTQDMECAQELICMSRKEGAEAISMDEKKDAFLAAVPSILGKHGRDHSSQSPPSSPIKFLRTGSPSSSDNNSYVDGSH